MDKKLKKYPKIKRLGDSETIPLKTSKNIIVTEKLDGNNFRFGLDENNKLVFGSRNTILGNGTDNKQFKPPVNYVKDNITPKDILKLEEDYTRLTFFGENMVRHSLDYDWDKIPQLLIFDIYDKDKEFLPFSEVSKIGDELGLTTVPLIDTINGSDFNANYEIPESKYRDGKAEGVVFKDYDKQVFGKLRSKEFFEKNRQAFGGNKRYAKTDSTLFVDTYCTNARIEKMIYKLRDEGHNLGMPLMKYLPKRVTRDIWEEEWEEIAFKNWEIDLKSIRKKISRRCVSVLKMTLANRMFEEGDR